MGIRLSGVNTGINWGNGVRLIGAGVPGISVSMWINIADLANCLGIFEITNPAGSARLEAIPNANGSISVGGRATDGETFKSFTTGTGILVEDEFMHIVVANDYVNDFSLVYKNGVLEDSATMGFADTLSSNTAPDYAFLGGANGDTGGDEFLGDMHDVRVYGRALTLKEIKTIHACEGVDGILDGLEIWMKGSDQPPGTAITTANIKDYSPNKYIPTGVYGTIAQFIEDPINVE